MQSNLIYIIYDLITIITGIWLLSDFEYKKEWILKKLGETLLFSAGTVLLFYGLMYLFKANGWQEQYVSRITVVAVLSLYAALFGKYSLETRITSICVLYIASFQLEAIRILFMVEFSLENRSDYNVVFVLIHTVIIVLSALFIRRYRIRETRNVPKTFCFFIVFITFISEVCNTVLSVSIWNSDLPEMTSIAVGKLVLGITFYLFNMLFYYMFYVLINHYTQSQEITLLRQKQSESVQELDRANQLYDAMRMLRHELKNDILSMEIMLKGKEYDKLEKHFSEITKSNAAILDRIECGNRVLNNILNVKKIDCNNRGVAFDAIAAVPAELPFDEKDLASLLVNLIDNAAEASLKTNAPSVSVKMKSEKNYCFITVINPVSGDILSDNPNLGTTKRDKSIHGIGLRVVKNIVDKYNGHIKFEQEGDMFIASLMLSLQ
jgi:signal transduction histidine kinase